MTNLTQDRLKKLLHYNTETGIFTRIKEYTTDNSLGSIAGCMDSKGYWKINVDGKSYRAHRLVWLYVFGKFPEKLIDHINRNKSDNRLINLRMVGYSENNQNHKINKRNTSGVTGVHLHKKSQKWHAMINLDKKPKYIGSFPTIEEAKAAREKAEKEFYFLPA